MCVVCMYIVAPHCSQLYEYCVFVLIFFKMVVDLLIFDSGAESVR